MMFPKKTRYKKNFKGRIKGNEYRVTKLTVGYLGIKILKSGRIKSSQLDAIRKSVMKKFKGNTKIWVQIFPHVCVTAKPIEVRMGKGKGNFSYWCTRVNAGRVIFELQEKSLSIAEKILKITTNKLGLPAILISR